MLNSLLILSPANNALHGFMLVKRRLEASRWAKIVPISCFADMFLC